MKKFSKVLSSLLAVTMAGTMLAGCGGGTAPAADSSTGTDSGAAAATDYGSGWAACRRTALLWSRR